MCYWRNSPQFLYIFVDYFLPCVNFCPYGVHAICRSQLWLFVYGRYYNYKRITDLHNVRSAHDWLSADFIKIISYVNIIGRMYAGESVSVRASGCGSPLSLGLGLGQF